MSSRPNDTCFCCGKQGHWVTNCPFKTPKKSPTPTQQTSSPSQFRSNDTCFNCGQQGHWVTDCPFKTPQKSLPSSPSNLNFPPYPCPHGHGLCFTGVSKTAKNPGKSFYTCNFRSSNVKCSFFKWCNEVEDFEPQSQRDQILIVNSDLSQMSLSSQTRSNHVDPSPRVERQTITVADKDSDDIIGVDSDVSSIQKLAQNRLVAILESTDPYDHKSMEEASKVTFSVLDRLSVNYSSFSEQVKVFISLSKSFSDIEESMKRKKYSSSSKEEITERYKNRRAEFANISRIHSEVVDDVAESDRRLRLLREEVSVLEAMLVRVGTENVELKTREGKLSEDLLESERKFQGAEAEKKLVEEMEAKHKAAMEALKSAKYQLRNSITK